MGVLTARFDLPGSMAKDDIRAAPPGWLKDFKNGRPDATMAEKVNAICALPRSGGRTLAQGALAQGGAGVDLGTNPADLANSRDQDCCPSFREGFGAGLRAIATGRCDRNPSVAVTFGSRLQLKQLAEIQTAACKLGISPIMHRKGKAHGPAALVRSTRNLSLRRWSRRVISAEAWPSCFLDIALVELGTAGQSGAQGMAGEETWPLGFRQVWPQVRLAGTRPDEPGNVLGGQSFARGHWPVAGTATKSGPTSILAQCRHWPNAWTGQVCPDEPGAISTSRPPVLPRGVIRTASSMISIQPPLCCEDPEGSGLADRRCQIGDAEPDELGRTGQGVCPAHPSSMTGIGPAERPCRPA